VTGHTIADCERDGTALLDFSSGIIAVGWPLRGGAPDHIQGSNMTGRERRSPLSAEHGTVFRTKLKREVADTIDWANKEDLDFNQVWDTIILNVRWKRELEGD
jgi:hypothetical protein